MPLYWFLLVVLSLGCGSLWEVDLDASRSLIATGGLCLGWGLLAKAAALIATSQLRRAEGDGLLIVRMFDRQLEVLRWLGLLAVVVCLAGFGYARWVESLPISEASMACRAALLLLPAMSIVALLWWADHQFGVANDLVEGGWRRAFHEGAAAFRLQAAWLILPVLLLLLLLDIVRVVPGLGDAAGGAVVVVVALSGVLLGLPMVVRRIWKTELLTASSPHAEVQAIVAAAGLRHLPTYRWDTGGRACNALIAGFVPRCRIMILSDRLLERLSTAEVTMIVCHELAHLRRWHVPLRASVILPAWGIVAAGSHLLPETGWATAASMATAVLVTLCLLVWVAHQTELDADRVACRLAVELAGRHDGDVPATIPQAAQTLADALVAVTADHPAAQRGTWLHPSVARRINRLDAFVQNECVAAGLEEGAVPVGLE